MLLASLLLAAAPAEIPAFDRAAMLNMCAAKEGDDLDGQYECLRDEIEDHHQFMTLWQTDKPERREGYRQCFAEKWDEEKNLPDWGMTIHCIEKMADPKLEVADSGGRFNLKKATAHCEGEKANPTTYPDGSQSGQDIGACLSDAAAGHRSFRLIRAKYQRQRASDTLKALDYCERTWVTNEARYDWGMAIFCANQQLSAPMMIAGLREIK